MHRWRSRLWIACLWTAGSGIASAADQYTLEVPGSPDKVSTVVAGDGRLRIVDSTGQAFDYQRQADLDADTPTGRFLGYYCRAADQYVLWPASGDGAMVIGTPAGGKITWRKSRMQIRQVLAAGGPGGTNAAPSPQDAGPMHVAVFGPSVGGLAVARIDAAGRLQLYRRTEASWRHAQSRLDAPLVPGAPLEFWPQKGDPLVRTFDRRGELLEIDGSQVRRVLASPGGPSFRPGAVLAGTTAIDDRGTLWQLDPTVPIDRQAGRHPAGCPVAAAESHVLAVDVDGRLLDYVRNPGPDARWSPPEVLGQGFVPGGGVAAHSYSPSPKRYELVAASVDAAGRPRVLRRSDDPVWPHKIRWSTEIIDGTVLPPGCLLSLAMAGGRLTLSAADAKGTWIELTRGADRWTARAIAAGFPVGTPVAADPFTPLLAAVDATGRVVVATREKEAWRLEVLAPQRGFVPSFPQLVSRTIESRPPLDPVRVTLANGHSVELLVRITDLGHPARPVEVAIPPGGSAAQSLDRDAGAELVEVHLVPGKRGEMVRQEHRHALPPRQIYSVAVRAKESLGAFPIALGEIGGPDARLDVYREVKARNNPGAAVCYGR
jgi:hypothetical protein